MTASAPSIDSTLKAGTTWARSGMWALARIAVGTSALPKSPPTSFSSASQQAPQKPSRELAGEPVDAADAERDRARLWD